MNKNDLILWKNEKILWDEVSFQMFISPKKNALKQAAALFYNRRFFEGRQYGLELYLAKRAASCRV